MERSSNVRISSLRQDRKRPVKRRSTSISCKLLLFTDLHAASELLTVPSSMFDFDNFTIHYRSGFAPSQVNYCPDAPRVKCKGTGQTPLSRLSIPSAAPSAPIEETIESNETLSIPREKVGQFGKPECEREEPITRRRRPTAVRMDTELEDHRDAVVSTSPSPRQPGSAEPKVHVRQRNKTLQAN
ncbi:hypothetical protein F2P81_000108 [Scophthalmus maximus]|uniref:Uncharacterized protein n=1 Tax=Scophthalmus maximus TaxID=52904 RepID=A0A6A4TMD9_SCOMX|nr:hypothetical protein F2P81_000108 [Scophthalmus maximus]